jgi:FKBP-type peptidyl-prolyl cis-trans isomerase
LRYLLIISNKMKNRTMIKRNIQLIVLFLSTVFIISLVSCNPARKYEKEEESKIRNYLATNFDKNFELKPSGLYYLETQAGTGILPATHDTVYLKYSGKFLDGTIFDSNVSLSTYLIFVVGEGTVISGLDQGVTFMHEGGKATLLIPSELAFSSTGSDYAYDPNYGYYQVIPGYTPLLFELELVHVSPGSGK